jgi:tetratricopeptide (TPR) repeat protein
VAWLAAFALGSGLTSHDSAAHGTHDARLARLNATIAGDPANDRLRLAKAVLQRQYGHWDAALASVEEAERLAPERRDLDLHRGRVLLDAGRAGAAIEAFDRFLESAPSHPGAREARARALARLGRPLEAADDYSIAIERQDPPIPDQYLARARALADGPEPRLARALAGLDEGLRVFGTLVALELYAVDLELRRDAYDAALSRLDRLADRAPGHGAWQVHRGEVLERARRIGQARAAFELALGEIRDLPRHRRSTPAVQRIEARARSGLERVASSGGSP